MAMNNIQLGIQEREEKRYAIRFYYTKSNNAKVNFSLATAIAIFKKKIFNCYFTIFSSLHNVCFDLIWTKIYSKSWVLKFILCNDKLISVQEKKKKWVQSNNCFYIHWRQAILVGLRTRKKKNFWETRKKNQKSWWVY